MKALILFLSLFFSFSLLCAQRFQKADLQMFNGSVKSGYVNPKSLEADAIVYKSSEDVQKENIPLSTVKNIVFNVDGQQHVIENVPYAFGEGMKKKFAWMVKLEDGHYNLYTHAMYGFTKDGDLVLSTEYLVGRTLPGMGYFIKKFDSNEAYPFAIYSNSPTYIGLHNVLKKNVRKYMADDPELVEKVNKKELSTKNVVRIVREYNQFKQKH